MKSSPGAADRSYGIQVAKLAGLPAQVVARAKQLLAEFEAADRVRRSDRLVADLPLFSASNAGERAADPAAPLAPAPARTPPRSDGRNRSR